MVKGDEPTQLKINLFAHLTNSAGKEGVGEFMVFDVNPPPWEYGHAWCKRHRGAALHE